MIEAEVSRVELCPIAGCGARLRVRFTPGVTSRISCPRCGSRLVPKGALLRSLEPPLSPLLRIPRHRRSPLAG